jgi:hypothetical protein
MSKPKRAHKNATHRKSDERQRIFLDQLKEIVTAIGIEVREEKLMREVGYTVHSGPCRLHGRDVVLLDSNASLSDLVEALLDFLAGRDLEAVYIEPQIRDQIVARSPKESRGAEG